MTDDHKADLGRVSTQHNFTDITRIADDLPQRGGMLSGLVNGTLRAIAHQNPCADVVAGSTDFGGTPLDLNQLLDLVERADPADVESSGKALWDARDAIKAAAEELSGHIDHVHWIGESGNAFRKWGGSLVGKAYQLSDFAGGAGDQLSAAAVGLASVRSAMPSPDTQVNRKRPHEFTEAEKVTHKDDYTVAVRVEKDRQEAINQMNRLASYYAVSNEQLAVVRRKAPTFEAMPDVGVPKPKPAARHGFRGAAYSPTTQENESIAEPSHRASSVQTLPAGNRDAADPPAPARHIVERTASPDVPVATPVGTHIDEVGTLPPPATTPPTASTPAPTGLPTPDGGTTNVFGAPLSNGIRSGGPGGAGGFRSPAPAQDRTRTPGAGASGSGRSPLRGPTSHVGGTTSSGQGIGRAAPTGAKASPTPPGRGVSGGTPRVGGTAAPGATGGPTGGAGPTNGVVGGRRTTTPGVSGQGGPRIPRGTVIGVGEAAGSRNTAARPGTRGVFGTPETTRRSSTGAAAGTGRGASASRKRAGGAETVTGRPTARRSETHAERNGMTHGGTGLVHGSGSGRKSDARGKAGDTSRPDDVIEENNAPLPTKPRRDQPPVID